MAILQVLVLAFFLITGLISILKPAAAARMTVKGLKWFMKLVGLQGDLIPTPRAVAFLRWWNVLMFGVTLATLYAVVASVE